ncbi:MAG: HDOD domain-containing protein [Gammaproteobacteria bacterium]
MSIETLLKHVYELPSIPKVVQELIMSFSSDSESAMDISARIQTDPVIAAKVLRLANSARYGVGRHVTSIDSAVVLLGVDVLKTLVISSGVSATMSHISGLNMKQFWRDSFLIANTSKILANCAADVDAETAFTCGLLHKIGIALMYFGNKEQMQCLASALEPNEDSRQKQREIFGYECDEVAARLAKMWCFPSVIQEALLRQHEPMQAEPFSPYAAIIKLALIIHEHLDHQVSIEDTISTLKKDMVDALRLDTYGVFKGMSKLCEAEDDIDLLLAA